MPTFRTIVILATLVFAAVTLQALGQNGSSIQDGVYSDKQATQGEKAFADVCSACHVDDAFSGANYMDGWDGQTVDDFVAFIQDTMPEDNPGGLRRSEYVSIVAFILKQNGVPSGESDLASTPDVLQNLTIEGPFDPS